MNWAPIGLALFCFPSLGIVLVVDLNILLGLFELCGFSQFCVGGRFDLLQVFLWLGVFGI